VQGGSEGKERVMEKERQVINPNVHHGPWDLVMPCVSFLLLWQTPERNNTRGKDLFWLLISVHLLGSIDLGQR
jgi:hypothetical protein